jgi:predicted DCC family thiol-disulfide oxidoreductase YuxK
VTSGWTGGQYSVARAVLGLSLAAAVLPAAAKGDTVGIAALLAALFVAAGAFDRWAALVLAGLWAVRIEPWDWTHLRAASAVPLLLLLAAAHQRAPYGSWDARGRLDPGGGWTFHPAWLAATGLLWALTQLHAAVETPSRTSHPLTLMLACLPITFVGIALFWRRRPRPWLAALGFEALVLALGGDRFRLDLALLYLFTFDPAWIPRRSPEAVETLFYDGTCGLCHRAVRFLLAEDPQGEAFRFAPLGGATFRAHVPADVRGRLPDSLVLLTADGGVLTRSTAARHLMHRLGGLWRALAVVLDLLPAGLLDAAYDGIARIRHRLFARPKDACPLLPPHLRQRFSD